MTSLAARVVALGVAVAVASTVVATVAFAGASGSQNAAQAGSTAQREAEQLSAVVVARDARLADVDAVALPGVRALQRVLASRGAASVIARPAQPDAVAPPFTAADLARVRAGRALVVQREVVGRAWAVRGAAAGRTVVLVAEPVDAARRLTAEQRRQLVVIALLTLLGGALAGLLLARGVTRPLARLADAARRMTAGERDLRVPLEGPTEVADVAGALAALSDALGRSEQRQRQFLLAVSHELRTPLTAVTGYAEAIADGAMTAQELPAAAAVIRDEAGRLQRRVEDLLALARLEADDFGLESAPCDVSVLLRAAAAAFGPRAAAAGVLLRVEAPPVGPIVTTDGERLRQMVDALVDNALRVLPEGAPLVLACRRAGPQWVRVEVRDGGPGLAPQDLAVAFERGVLTERYRGSRAVGSGLGLALVGELARRLGGRADARPAPEGGVAFSVMLPA